MMIIRLIDILNLAGFDSTLKTKIVRHQDRRYDMQELRRNDWLELYQCYQGKPIFGDAKQIVSFYGLPGSRAQFYGVYKIKDVRRHQVGEVSVLDTCHWAKEWDQSAKFVYDLEDLNMTSNSNK